MRNSKRKLTVYNCPKCGNNSKYQEVLSLFGNHAECRVCGFCRTRYMIINNKVVVSNVEFLWRN